MNAKEAREQTEISCRNWLEEKEKEIDILIAIASSSGNNEIVFRESGNTNFDKRLRDHYKGKGFQFRDINPHPQDIGRFKKTFMFW